MEARLVVLTKMAPRRAMRASAALVEPCREMGQPVSAEARANGWRGFDGIGEKVPGGWQYDCDGMPHPMGCGEQITVTRRYARVGLKSTGWLVCYGQEAIDPAAPFDAPGNLADDTDVVLTFGPRCAAVVLAQALTAATQPAGDEREAGK